MNLAYALDTGIFRHTFRNILFRLRRKGRASIPFALPGGGHMSLPVHSSFSFDVFVTDAHVDWGCEQILYRYLAEKKGGRVFLDVGANIGYYSAFMAPVAERVYSVEPDQRVHPALRANIDSPKHQFLPIALSDAIGEATLAVGADTAVSHLTKAPPRAGQSVTVTVSTLDELDRQYDFPVNSAVKLDVEGHVVPILRGAREFTQRKHPIYLIEIWPDECDPETMAGLTAFLRDSSYRILGPIKSSDYWRTRTSEFRRIDASELGKVSTKMVFLVPDDFTALDRHLGPLKNDLRGGPCSVGLRPLHIHPRLR